MAGACLLLMLQADIIGAIVCVWTTVIGAWFYAIMLAALEIAVALKYEDVTAPAVIGLIAGVLMVNYIPPEAMMIPIGIIVINLAAVVYARLFQ